MKVSIIIPIYNAEKNLNECLDSIKKQRYTDFEVLMIDDGSSDNSKNICKEYTEDKRYKYYFKENGGVSSARNFGLSKLTGEYVCFVDSDDIVSANYLSDFVDNITNEKSLICCDLTNDYLMLGIGQNKPIKKYMDNDKYNIIYEDCSCFMCNRMFNTKIIKENNILFRNDVFMCEDLIFNLKYMDYISEILYVQNKNYYYRIIQTSLSRMMNNTQWFTISNALETLLDKYDSFNIYTKRKTIYFCWTVIIEYNYRMKHVDDVIDKSKIIKIKNTIKNKKEKMYFKDFIKFIVYRIFTKSVIKFKYK